mmetsp:Transcript_24632/g.36497  ORF Transcript_24632/g.36497 Transcript_24632/m.36497 type:complete len:81 (+) Transcript_24632:1-243(+)
MRYGMGPPGPPPMAQRRQHFQPSHWKAKTFDCIMYPRGKIRRVLKMIQFNQVAETWVGNVPAMSLKTDAKEVSSPLFEFK